MESLITPSAETGKLNIVHLKRYWSRSLAQRNRSIPQDMFQEEWPVDVALLSTLGLGLEQTIRYIFNENPDFDTFEDWVLMVNDGKLSQGKIAAFNEQMAGGVSILTDGIEAVLDDDALSFWDKNGYVILKGAIPREDCDRTVDLICSFLGVKRNDPSTWYTAHPDRQGIMVQLFQHEQLQKNRSNDMIRKAFTQLWGRKDILVNADRVGFNPPETGSYKFPGPRLHWDVSLDLPVPFGTQGIIYLADTAANQGAFTLVPGFHNSIGDWIGSLPPGADPRAQDLYALNPLPIAAGAGDCIIWHHALPHGSSPNTATLPRYVQYINYQPLDPEIRHNWI